MAINADFEKRVTVHDSENAWQASPMPGVERKMLDRIGEEVARATTIVRYAPGSHFSSHVHSGGEEFLVLEGTFQDEHGDYPKGTYVRNPIGTEHTPRADEGCVILVKLWQYDAQDQKQFSVTLDPQQTKQPLHSFEAETVWFQGLNANEIQSVDTAGGAEILVLEGTIRESGEHLGKHDWLRVPDGYDLSVEAGSEGARLWVKTGHLNEIKIPCS